MNLNVMKYKNYVWPNNPSTIDISVKRDLKDIEMPFNLGVIQDFGRQKRIVSGQGKFFGENCLEQFESLFTVLKQGGTGYLCLPGMTPFLAIFSELQLIGEAMPNVISYKFEFWEDLSSSFVSDNLDQTYHTVLDGDTLWSIAAKYNVSIEDLISLNCNIKNPNQLTVGERVYLK